MLSCLATRVATRTFKFQWLAPFYLWWRETVLKLEKSTYILSPIAAVFFKLWSSISQLMLISCVFTYPKINWLSSRRSHYLVFWNVAVSTQSQIKKLLYKKEQKESRFLWNRAHSYCSFASLKWFRKTHVRNVFLINDDKILSSLLNL